MTNNKSRNSSKRKRSISDNNEDIDTERHVNHNKEDNTNEKKNTISDNNNKLQSSNRNNDNNNIIISLSNSSNKNDISSNSHNHSISNKACNNITSSPSLNIIKPNNNNTETLSIVTNDTNLTKPTSPYRKVLKEGEPGTLSGRPLRLFADGIFDLFHFGHAKALQQCKQSYPNVYLLVGCNNDEMTNKYKGKTVMNEKERYESLRHCKWIDEVIEGSPWVLTDEFLEKYKIDYVCHDALPYTDASGLSGEDKDVYARIKKMGKFLETKRTEGISTSDLIIRIISEYDSFIRRNLKRGYTGKEMNVPFIKEQSIKFDLAMEKVTNKTKEAAKDVDELIHKLIGKAEDMQHGFLGLFNKDGPLRTSLRKRRMIIKERLTDIARESAC